LQANCEGFSSIPHSLTYFSFAPLFSAFGGWSFGGNSTQRNSRGKSKSIGRAVVVVVLLLLAVAGLVALAPGITSWAGFRGSTTGSHAIAVSSGSGSLFCAAPWLAQLKAAATAAAVSICEAMQAATAAAVRIFEAMQAGAVCISGAIQAVMPSLSCAAPSLLALPPAAAAAAPAGALSSIGVPWLINLAATALAGNCSSLLNATNATAAAAAAPAPAPAALAFSLQLPAEATMLAVPNSSSSSTAGDMVCSISAGQELHMSLWPAAIKQQQLAVFADTRNYSMVSRAVSSAVSLTAWLQRYMAAFSAWAAATSGKWPC
jgi:hypothetical protein